MTEQLQRFTLWLIELTLTQHNFYYIPLALDSKTLTILTILEIVELEPVEEALIRRGPSWNKFMITVCKSSLVTELSK